jgi:hypothetical protein
MLYLQTNHSLNNLIMLKKHVLIAALCSAAMTACNPIYYSPNSHNVPLFTQKGETNATLAGNSNRIEVQGAYAVTDQIAVKVNGGLFRPDDLDNGNGGSGKLIEFGGGYYRPVGNLFVFETYGIAGFGSMENHLPSTVAANPQTRGDISANLFRLGIQPNFGLKNKYVSAAISTRLAYLGYYNINGDLIFADKDQVQYLKENNSHLLIEPALTLRTGIKNVKLQFQLGLSLNATDSGFDQDQGFATLGLNFNFQQNQGK